MATKKAMLIDVDYRQQDGEGMIRVTLKDDKVFFMFDPAFRPYFYIDSDSQEIKPGVFGITEVMEVKKVKKIVGKTEKELLQVVCRNPQDVPVLSELFSRYGKVYENKILFGTRYIINNRLRPMNDVEIEYDEKNEFVIKSIKDAGESKNKLNTMAFDIEVYAPNVVPKEDEDPVTIISYSQNKKGGAVVAREFGGGIEGAEAVNGERALINRFCEIVKERDVELLFGYNSSNFDIPYLAVRAGHLGIPLALGREGSEPRIKKFGMSTKAELDGRIHFDVFYTVRIMAAAQAIKLQRFTLEEVYNEIVGPKKWKFDYKEMAPMWDDDKRRREMVEYGIIDSIATEEIFERIFPLQIELARLCQMPLAQISGATTGQLVESLLINEANKQNVVIPPKPDDTMTAERKQAPIEGAYVKIPQPGIYENIIVYDFRSLYPSLLTSFNIDPNTVNCGHEECKTGKNVSPIGHYFCTKEVGLVPSTMRHMLDRRKEAKAQLKDAEGYEQSVLNAKVSAMKIILNTSYGMLAYERARWYSRESAESITAWGRFYVQDVAKKAEEFGFEVLYGDTDSIFLLQGEKTEEDATKFMDMINKSLVGTMELELEDIYTRGVFVSKKQQKEKKGAKKKYALINKKGKIKVRGFELVRRDWSKIAKETQKDVLDAILKDGDKEKAFQIVKETVRRLKDGKVSMEDLTIYTQVKKKHYEIASPESSAAEKARKRGREVPVGAIIGFVITPNGESVSQKAELVEFAESYDADYYIDRQILPATLKILGELGYSEDDIKYSGRQSSLDSWF